MMPVAPHPSRPLRWLLAPWHALALLGSDKSFRGNLVLGSPALNRAGLHATRVQLADRMAQSRRNRLRSRISVEDAAAFDRDGYIIKSDFLPPDIFTALKAAVLAHAAPARAMLEGDAITRKVPVDADMLRALPLLRQLTGNTDWLGLIHYAGASALLPQIYVQTILAHVRPGGGDPQLRLHSDTFHATVKAWLFLTDVAEGPFTYIPGSHRLTPQRLAWLKHKSLTARNSPDAETREGSFRVLESELVGLDLPPPRQFKVPANTLIVADTMGFHARGASHNPNTRIEIWAYGRRNPFLPWTGLDPAGLPLLRDHGVRFYWQAMDWAERLGLGRNRWRPAGTVTPDAPPDLSPFER